jgi:hypothetical protein
MTRWLRADELRLGLGCMRLDPDDVATVGAAVEAGISAPMVSPLQDGIRNGRRGWRRIRA